MKTWLVVKHWYGDFDIGQETVVAAGDESLVKGEVAKLNGKRTAEEIEHCVKYTAESVKTLR